MMTAPPESADEPVVIEKAAAAAREAVVQEDATRTWHGVQLKPWSQERQCLLDALCAADVPMPDPSVDAVTYYQGLFPWAMKVLYLAHHEPADWERQRPRLLALITQWAFADYIPAWLEGEERKAFKPTRCNVPGETIEEKIAAVNFADKMVSAHQKVMALRRVKRMGASADSGNTQSP